jgi:hypothetical protein
MLSSFPFQKCIDKDKQDTKIGRCKYGCEISPFTLREERRLRIFENRELKKIFGPKMDEATGQ